MTAPPVAQLHVQRTIRDHSTTLSDEQLAQFPVALVTMPFISITRPSIQIGLLKSILQTQGFPTTTLHLNLDFAAIIDVSFYERLCQHRGHMYGDWLFSKAAFGIDAPDPDHALYTRFTEDLDNLFGQSDTTLGHLIELRDRIIPAYIQQMLATLPWESFKVVGFSSTFQQTVASIALATKLKEQYPQLITIFGGANFDGSMGAEFARSIMAIDYVVSGEADLALPSLLRCLALGRSGDDIPHVIRRDGANRVPPAARRFQTNLETLPAPNYYEYFERAEALGLLSKGGRRTVYLPFESARGCWWGQKHQCTFCGLNGTGIAYRSKSPDKVKAELTELARNYRSFRFEAVDNIIDRSYLDRLFPMLAADESTFEFFYEVKSNLSKDQLKKLRDGGVAQLQPGIESLNSRVLHLMHKGVTAIQNVNTMRWALYYGIGLGWNLLWGFPGEEEEDYIRQGALLKQITHLQPPGGAGRIWMERFSPIFTDRQAFPLRHRSPEASYWYVYPKYVDLEEIAYFFDYELENTLPDSAFLSTSLNVRHWQDLWKAPDKPSLRYWTAPDYLLIEDCREPENPGTYTFHGPLAGLYLAASNQPHSAAALRRGLELPFSEEEVVAALDGFCDSGLMMRDGSLYLSLGLPAQVAAA